MDPKHTPEYLPQYLQGLNTYQREAVEHTEGPLLIVAGAGAGKTRVLVHRILHLIHKGVSPEKILAITFTNKAAREMRERVRSLIESEKSLRLDVSAKELPFISTFHSFGVHLLRANSVRAGIAQRFSIYDRADSLRVIKEAMKAGGIDIQQFEPRKILGTISKQKGEGKSPSAYETNAGSNFYPRLVSGVWREYEKILAREKALDFDDLLYRAVGLLQKQDEIRTRYQNRFSHIMVDEYQDTNKIQYDMLDMLAAKHRNICVVGDHDQNVYSWRGSSLENILDFEKRFPEAKTVILEQNYRSTKTIIAVSNEIIQKNIRRKEKNLFTQNKDGEKIALYSAYDEGDEASFVADTVATLLADGATPNDIAVLYRANFQSRALEEAFLEKGIQYRVLGTKFFERKEIKDTLAYLSAALSPESTGHIARIINTPARGIGKVTLLRVLAKKEKTLTPKMREKVEHFFTLLYSIRKVIEEKSASESVRFVIEQSGMLSHYKKGSTDDVERIENLKELVSLAKKYNHLAPRESIEALLDDAALQSEQDGMPDAHAPKEKAGEKAVGDESEGETENDKTKDAVTLMTVHAAKGLEFPFVFVTGLEEGLFPHERDNAEEIDDEEERRLFYVALTRAKEKVYLSYASVRTVFGSRKVNLPSEFITDINDEFLETVERTRGEKVIYI